MATNYSLLIPTQVQGVLVAKDTKICGQETDFKSFPWMDRQKKHINSTSPPLSSTITKPLFYVPDSVLYKGVHLHWILPQAFTTPTKSGSRDFPAVPTHWAIIRLNSQVIDGVWGLVSTRLRTKMVADSTTVPIPQQPTGSASGSQPYRYMGRWQQFNDTSALDAYFTSAEDEWKNLYKNTSGSGNSSALTTIGYGNPMFSAYYPNCKSVFGFHDPTVTDAGTGNYQYVVIGKMSDPSDDVICKETQSGLLSFSDFKQYLDHQFGLTVGQAIDHSTSVAPDKTEYASICYGLFWLNSNKGIVPDTLSKATWSMGSNTMEAISAFLAKKIAPSTTDLGPLEQQLASILMDNELTSGALDLTAEFERIVHRNSMHHLPGGSVWQVVANKSSGSTKNQLSEGAQHLVQTLLEANPSVVEALDKLNRAQRQEYQHNEKLSSLKKQLYADWYRQMQVAYEGKGVVPKKLQTAITECSLSKLVASEWGQIVIESGKIIPVKAAHGTCQGLLFEVNNSDQYPGWKFDLQATPDDWYWEPQEPVILLADLDVDEQEQIGHADASTCYFQNWSGEFSSADDAKAVDLLIKTLSDRTLYPINSPGITQSRTNWNPFILEWAANFESLTMKDKNDVYLTDAVSKNFDLLANNANLTIKTSASSTAGPAFDPAAVVGGSAVLSPFPKQVYLYHCAQFIIKSLSLLVDPEAMPQAKINLAFGHAKTYTTTKSPAWADPVWTASQALVTLLKSNILTQNLDGFSLYLQGRSNALQMQPVDPLGSPSRVQMVDGIKALLSDTPLTAPIDDQVFNPLRCGKLSISKLRLRDNFGIPKDVTVKSNTLEAFSINFKTASIDKSQPFLTPSLLPPMRLDAGWLSATDDTISPYRYTPSNPVCGWIMIDKLENNLMVFDLAGHCLGLLLDTKGTGTSRTWQPAPVQDSGYIVREIGDIDNLHLQGVVNWLATTTTPLDEWINLAETAQNNIAATSFAGNDAMALLLGRPMAITRMAFQFDTQGDFVQDQSWQGIASMQSGKPDTKQYEKVKLPVRIGQADQLTDGVVAFWPENGNSNPTVNLGCLLYMPQSTPTRTVPNVVFGDSDDFVQWHSLEEKAVHVTLLVDPLSAVHLTTGLVPRLHLNIESEWVSMAVNRMRPLMRMGPILTPLTNDQALYVSVPKEAGYSWTWFDTPTANANGSIIKPVTDARLDSDTHIVDGLLQLKSDSS